MQCGPPLFKILLILSPLWCLNCTLCYSHPLLSSLCLPHLPLHLESLHNSVVPSAASKKCSRTVTIRNAWIYVLCPLLFAANSFLPVHRKVIGKVLFSVGFSSPSSKCLSGLRRAGGSAVFWLTDAQIRLFLQVQFTGQLCLSLQNYKVKGVI